MDPYLERHWRDVHTKLIAYASDELNQRLPGDLIARAEERTTIEAQAGDGEDLPHRRTVMPDVNIFEKIEDFAKAPAEGGGVALAPYRISFLTEPAVERFIEIVDVRDGERVVTVLEFLSASNKSNGLEAFIEKRNELLTGGVNFVEVDLIREGDWRRLLAASFPTKAQSAYRAVLRVAGNPPQGWLHPFPLREALPTIKIPLRKNEPPCELELQPLIDQAYRNGRYSRTIDYSRPCEPPLNADDAAWAGELLRARKISAGA